MMSYYPSPSIQGSYYGVTEFEDEREGIDEDEYLKELTVYFDYHEWSEGHPYGEGSAYERLSEWAWTELQVDEDTVTYDQLVEIVGKENADRLIENAVENGIDSI